MGSCSCFGRPTAANLSAVSSSDSVSSQSKCAAFGRLITKCLGCFRFDRVAPPPVPAVSAAPAPQAAPAPPAQTLSEMKGRLFEGRTETILFSCFGFGRVASPAAPAHTAHTAPPAVSAPPAQAASPPCTLTQLKAELFSGATLTSTSTSVVMAQQSRPRVLVRVHVQVV